MEVLHTSVSTALMTSGVPLADRALLTGGSTPLKGVIEILLGTESPVGTPVTIGTDSQAAGRPVGTVTIATIRTRGSTNISTQMQAGATGAATERPGE